MLSLICYLGLILGKIRVKGISLGVAFVFFIGIIAMKKCVFFQWIVFLLIYLRTESGAKKQIGRAHV